MLPFGSKKVLAKMENLVKQMNGISDYYSLPFYLYVDGNNKSDYCIKFAIELNETLPNELRKKCVEHMQNSIMFDNEKEMFIRGNIDRFTILDNAYINSAIVIDKFKIEYEDFCDVMNEVLA